MCSDITYSDWDNLNIQIGKFNLQDLSLDYLRQQVILVPQESHFWGRSIVENFRLGSPQIAFEQIVDACKKVWTFRDMFH